MTRIVKLTILRSALVSAIAFGLMTTAGHAQAGSDDGEVSRPPGTLTFNKDIAPIIFQNCVECHHQGGSAPFSLLSYPDARKHAKQIAVVTNSRYMPPWLPEPGYGEFVGQRRLTEDQIS